MILDDNMTITKKIDSESNFFKMIDSYIRLSLKYYDLVKTRESKIFKMEMQMYGKGSLLIPLLICSDSPNMFTGYNVYKYNMYIDIEPRGYDLNDVVRQIKEVWGNKVDINYIHLNKSEIIYMFEKIRGRLASMQDLLDLQYIESYLTEYP